ncbi:MAG: DUF2085 domain-containing protein [Balneolaceae bacterium]|nr:DUF2085 domain-containing protein [Balneolaceae bacterium]
MWANLKQKKLYGLVLSLSALLVFIALGGGVLNQPGLWFEHWQHKAFYGLCHQDPQRSFWINGNPMAVCSRCFGIYSAVFIGWLSFPMVPALLEKIDGYKRWLLVAVVPINFIDVFGNFIEIWQNTHLSRFALGSLIGFSAVLVIGYEFIGINHITIKGIQYGTDKST